MAAPKGNNFARGLTNNGQPPMYKNPKEMEDRCFDYFQECKDLKEKSTITGLALFLGFESRQSFYDYAKKDDFSYILKRAKLAIENSYELSGTAFDIFALKNMGWEDKSQKDITTNGNSINPLTKEELEKFNKDLEEEI